MSEDTQVYELLTKAFQEERLTVPMTEIERRAGVRRGRWVPVAAAVVVLAMLTGYTVWQRAHRSHLTTLDNLTSACMAHWAQLAKTLPANVNPQRPQRAFSFGTGEHTARVYSNGEVLVECVRNGSQTEAGSIVHDGGRSPLSGGNKGLIFFGHYGKPGYLVGELPEGTTSVKARLTNGDEVQAQIAGNLFGLWHPSASLIGAVVSAENAQGTQHSASEPSMLGGVREETTIDAMCRSKISQASLPNPTTEMRLIFHQKTPPIQQRVYINEWVVARCEVDERISSTVMAPVAKPLAEMMPMGYYGGGTVYPAGSSMFYFGRAPASATQVELHLADGTVVETALVEGFFLAFSTNTRNVVKVVAYTPTTIYTLENRVTTSVPRG